MSQCVTISFYHMGSLGARAWAFWMMGAARAPMARIPGLSFWKLCGSGLGEGFTPTLFPHNFAIFCVWDDVDTARAQLAHQPVFARYAAHASETMTVYLAPTSVRGAWSGVTPFHAGQTTTTGPLAALTRATVKPRIAVRFWRRVPEISDVIGADPNVVFKIGIGEVPLLHQVTFSIWPDASAMADFARKGGPHARAIKAVRDGDWFAEELYARFAVTDATGTWNGRNPLHEMDQAA